MPWRMRVRRMFPVLIPLNLAILAVWLAGSNWTTTENLTFTAGLLVALGGAFLLSRGSHRTGWGVAGTGLCACLTVALVLVLRAL